MLHIKSFKRSDPRVFVVHLIFVFEITGPTIHRRMHYTGECTTHGVCSRRCSEPPGMQITTACKARKVFFEKYTVKTVFRPPAPAPRRKLRCLSGVPPVVVVVTLANILFGASRSVVA